MISLLAVAVIFGALKGTNKTPETHRIPPWKLEHRLLAAAAATMELADWLQTVDARRRRYEGYGETNFILGPDPSVGRLNSYTAAALVGTFAIAVVLPDVPRTIFLAGVTRRG